MKKEISLKNIISECMSDSPCCLCGKEAEAVGSFVPEHPEFFGMDESQTLYFPICTNCLLFPVDLEKIEQDALAEFIKGASQ